MNVCRYCGGNCVELPVPGAKSMLSDGRRVEAQLKRISCLACGATSRLDVGDVRATFDEAYALGGAAGAADNARGSVYARHVLEGIELPASPSILDVGCGAGGLLRAIKSLLPHARLMGIEAAAQAASAAADDGISIHHGFAEDLPASAAFDLVCSVNVIEHTEDPISFLRALAAHVNDDGSIVVVCPRVDRPNLELMFLDHLHGLSAEALRLIGARAGLSLIRHDWLPDAGDFQLCVFKKREDDGCLRATVQNCQALAGDRKAYLEAWQNLDAHLASQLDADDVVVGFGASEAAALLRAYAPAIFARLEELAVDDTSSAWDLGKPIASYSNERWPKERAVLVAVHPARQNRVAERLRKDGYRPLLWPREITR